MYTYWALVQTVPGGFMRVTCQADNTYNATQIFKSLYGSKLLSEAAAAVA
jgi:hypothetical protein